MPEADVLKYFSQLGFRRLFQGIKRKYQSLGRIGGKVQLRNLNPEEAGGRFLPPD